MRSLNLIDFCSGGAFSIDSCVQLVCLAGLSVALSVGSSLRLVCASSCWDESSGVHPGVCFSRSFRLFVTFFGVVSGRPLFLCFMARTGGTNNVSHCAIPVQDFFPSATDSMEDFKHSVMIVTQSTFSPSYVAMTNLALYFGMARGRECTNPYSNNTWDTSVISARSMVEATYSGFSCGGASTMRRNPSRPFLVNHSFVASESDMAPASSSLLSVRVFEMGMCFVRLRAHVSFCALHNLSSLNERPSFGL